MKVFFCCPGDVPPCIDPAIAALLKASIEVEKLTSFADLRALVTQNNASGLVCIFPAISKPELTQALTLVLENKEAIKTGTVRPIAFLKLADPRILTLLRKQGIAEVFETTASTKELLFKVNKSLQTIEMTLSRKKDPGMEMSIREGGGAREVARKSTSPDVRVEWVPPISAPSDTWILDHAQVRSVMGRWLIEVMGPGPAAGGWTEELGKQTGGNQVWRWKARDPANDPFTAFGSGEIGFWTFVGRQPEFIWATNRWRLVSTAPSLSFLREGKDPIHRFIIDKTAFKVSENSQIALAKRNAITATFEASLHLKNDKSGQSSGSTRFKEEAGAGSPWNSNLTPDEKARDWNSDIKPDEPGGVAWNSDIKPDAAAKEWGGLDTGRGNRFESGRGLGMGQADVTNQGYAYDYEDQAEASKIPFKKGEAAFEKLELSVEVIMPTGETKPAHLLERDQNHVIVEIPRQSLTPKTVLTFKLRLYDGRKTRNWQFQSDHFSEELSESEEMILRLSVPPESQSAVDAVFTEYQRWQGDCLRFLESARGVDL